eukprot:1252027-Ditylum_brightwellii.AAC.1
MPPIFLVLLHVLDCLAITQDVLFHDGFSKNGLGGVICLLLDLSQMAINGSFFLARNASFCSSSKVFNSSAKMFS